MKVYVDEFPKDCIDCPCESEYYCNLLHEDVGCLKWGEIHKNCPLQSLSDYTKQVRKEVCELVRVKADDKYFEMGDDGEIPCGWVISEEKLKQIEQGQPK